MTQQRIDPVDSMMRSLVGRVAALEVAEGPRKSDTADGRILRSSKRGLQAFVQAGTNLEFPLGHAMDTLDYMQYSGVSGGRLEPM